MTFASKAIRFFDNLETPQSLPKGVIAMNPYEDAAVMKNMKAFFKKFYSDTNKRTFIIGINPGRFGAGITGIPFTDPVKMREELGLENDMGDKKEFSADFIYSVIHSYGGVDKFFSRFYINSVSPLGYTRNGKNYNYYDDPALVKALEGYIVNSLWEQIKIGAVREDVICLGTGSNYKFLKKLNEKHGFFGNIHPIEHPRYILQYKRRSIGEYVKKYNGLLKSLS
jgi:hypothetical protein